MAKENLNTMISRFDLADTDQQSSTSTRNNIDMFG